MAHQRRPEPEESQFPVAPACAMVSDHPWNPVLGWVGKIPWPSTPEVVPEDSLG